MMTRGGLSIASLLPFLRHIASYTPRVHSDVVVLKGQIPGDTLYHVDIISRLRFPWVCDPNL